MTLLKIERALWWDLSKFVKTELEVPDSPRSWIWISFGTATRPRFSILDFSAPRPWSQIFFTTASRRRKKNTLRLLVVESNTASRWRTPRAGRENQNYFSMLENFQKHFRIWYFYRICIFFKKIDWVGGKLAAPTESAFQNLFCRKIFEICWSNSNFIWLSRLRYPLPIRNYSKTVSTLIDVH